MIYYYSSPCDNSWVSLVDSNIKTLLMSYAVDAKRGITLLQDEMFTDPDNTRILIDSGAFSVWNSGRPPINVEEYCQFCENLWKQRDRFKQLTFINLDVIPPSKATKKELNKCIDEGKENFLFLSERLGVENILGVHHTGEPIELAEFYVDNGCVYLGVAPHHLQEKTKRKYFIDMICSMPQGMRFHGLGYSSFEGLFKIPFYSIDSISYKRYNEPWSDMAFWCGNKAMEFLQTENIRKYEALIKMVTDFWTKKGIIWND